MGDKVITLRVDDDLLRECKGKGWHYRDVFLMGVEAKRGNPALLARVNQNEESLSRLQKAYARLWQELKDEQTAKLEGI